MTNLKIGGIEQISLNDGPGLRLVIFFSKCLHKCPGCIVLNSTATIKTPMGEIPIKNINIGDIISSPNGDTIVTNLLYDTQNCYEITLEDGTILQVGENHKFIIDNKILLARDLNIGDFLLKQ